jgi:outer membrane receptor protein involved in Fe transport
VTSCGWGLLHRGAPRNRILNECVGGGVVKRILFILLVVFFLSANSFASDPGNPEPVPIKELLFYQLEELTSVSFFDISTRKAPGYSYVITSDQIEKSPERTLDDIIAMRVPGMTTGRHERTGALIGTRGILIDNNAKTMVMLDGQQINQRSHFGYSAGLLSPLLGDIKQVEFILGPGAILHGSGALNGFINLVPKNGKDNPGVFVNSEYGSEDKAWKFETGYGASYGEDKNLFLYGGVYGAEGFEPDQLFGSIKTFEIHSHGFNDGNYRFSAYWNHKKFNLNTFFYENNPYKNNSIEAGYFHQATLGIRPKYIFTIADTDSVELIGSFLLMDHSSPPIPGMPAKAGGSESHWDLKNIYRTTRWSRNSLAAGFSFGEKRFFENKQFFSNDAERPLGTVDTKWSEFSVFAEDVIALSKSWTASFGLRYDKIYLGDMSDIAWTEKKRPDEIEGHYSPRIATAYELDANTTVKVSYQHGFRDPDAAYYRLNLTYRDAAESHGIDFPALKIETLDSYEVNLQKNFPEKKLKVNCNIFYNIFDDLLSFQFLKDTGSFTDEEIALIKEALGLPLDQVPGSFLNEKDTLRAWGGEIGVTFQPVSNTEVRVSYGYVKSNEDQMRYPTHQIKLNTLSYFFNNKLALGLDYLFNSRYSGSNLPVADSIYRDNRHVVDVSLLYNITRDVSIKLVAQNLFENDVPPMVFTPDSPEKGGLGFDQRLIYVSLMVKLK